MTRGVEGWDDGMVGDASDIDRQINDSDPETGSAFTEKLAEFSRLKK